MSRNVVWQAGGGCEMSAFGKLLQVFVIVRVESIEVGFDSLNTVMWGVALRCEQEIDDVSRD